MQQRGKLERRKQETHRKASEQGKLWDLCVFECVFVSVQSIILMIDFLMVVNAKNDIEMQINKSKTNLNSVINVSEENRDVWFSLDKH